MKNIKLYSPGLILLVLFVIISLFTFKDYGLSWDEPLTKEMAHVYYNYVFNGDNKLVTYIERDHGSGFELPLVCLEKMFHLSGEKEIFEMRHLVTNLFFLLSAFCGYLLFYRLFKKQWLACLGFLLLVLQPRIYAHSFFNSKDIPFLSMFLVSLVVCQVAFTTKRTKWYMLLGVACGYTCSIRITGILLPAVFSALFCIDIASAFINKEKASVIIKQFLLFLVSFCSVFILFWPTLWSNPVHNFVECYGMMSHFRWVGDVLFNGTTYPSNNLPWYYIPMWFCISTPIVWLIAGFIGIVWSLVIFFKRPLNGILNTQTRFYLVCVALFSLPVIMILLLHSVVYDDWRHVYFIYTPFVILALFAINKLSEWKGRWIILSLCLVQVGILSVFMIKNHPFQSVYLNEFISRGKEHIRKSFEMDYWASSHKQGLEYIVAHDTATTIRVWIYPNLENNIAMLPINDRKRIIKVDKDEHPDYFITTFRTHPGDYEYPQVFYDIIVLNSTILRVYKMSATSK